MRTRVQFRAISGHSETARTAGTGMFCLVRPGALEGTRTPNLLIRSRVLGVRPVHQSLFPQVKVRRMSVQDARFL
jgi:hypothetical protein